MSAFIGWFIRVLMRIAGFRCQTCGELTMERDNKGVLRCFECRAKLEIRSDP